jgi:hypothetical protein
MSQQLQFSLAHYHAFYKKIKLKTSTEDAKTNIKKSLSKTLGGMISDIQKEAPLAPELTKTLEAILRERNWLTHNVDIELAQKIKISGELGDFIIRMNTLVQNIFDVIEELDIIGAAMEQNMTAEK